MSFSLLPEIPRDLLLPPLLYYTQHPPPPPLFFLASCHRPFPLAQRATRDLLLPPLPYYTQHPPSPLLSFLASCRRPFPLAQRTTQSPYQNNVIPQSTETTEHIVQPDCKPVSPSLEVNEQIHNGAEEQLSADIVARVSEAYHFDGMVDYQHVLAVHADSRRSKKRNLADLEPQLGGLMDVDQEDLMIILPPLFSLKDRPEKLIFLPSNSLRIEMEESGEGNGVKGQGICNTW
ncbi:hypothetical protein ACS0TY_033988 [Phlomoides rotata]